MYALAYMYIQARSGAKAIMAIISYILNFAALHDTASASQVTAQLVTFVAKASKRRWLTHLATGCSLCIHSLDVRL